jgi:hypothetical protein
MRPDQVRRPQEAEPSVPVPAYEVELRLMLGWRLCDEPGCGNIRMMPPTSRMIREGHPDG